MFPSADWIVSPLRSSFFWTFTSSTNLRVFRKSACSLGDGVDLDSMRSDDQPRSIQIHPSDNVAIVVNEGGLPAGPRFQSGLALREAITESHKVAVTTISEGAPTIRYGVRI